MVNVTYKEYGTASLTEPEKPNSISLPTFNNSLEFELQRQQQDASYNPWPLEASAYTTNSDEPSTHDSASGYTEDEAALFEDDHKDDGYEDSCSLYADSQASITTSLDSSVLKYQFENGRRYHNYRGGRYLLPNDDVEQDRMDMLHKLFLMLTGDKLIECPLTDAPQKVLDLGTGTGNWAIDFGDMYPSAEVWGSDLSPIQPDWVPPNVKFEIDDVEDTWLWPKNNFDLIHSRTLLGSIRDWRQLLEACFEHLKPGGFLELQEADVTNPLSPDGKVPPAWARYNELLRESSIRSGKRFDITPQLKGMMRDVGFVDVEEVVYPVPHGPWHKSKHLKEIGQWALEVFEQGTEAFALAPFTRILGMDVEEVGEVIKDAREEIKNPMSGKFYINMHFLYGRKPEPSEIHAL